MADLTRTAVRDTEIAETLHSVTAACVELIPHADSADILMVSAPEQYESLAPTSELASSLDDLQHRVGEGPCLSAMVGDSIVRCDDLRDDPRFPLFAKSAVAAGVLSMLSFQLITHDQRVAALNIVGLTLNCFRAEDEALGAMFATHAALALIANDRQTQFESALASRDLIGQAKGQIMERFSVDAVRAFELLRKLSQDSNVRVVDVAAQIVLRGSAPTPRVGGNGRGRVLRW
jgi:GAF domain-containing protein